MISKLRRSDIAWRSSKLAFAVFISGIILDENSPVRFHNLMAATGLKQAPVHDSMHGPPLNNS
jgi:hypothetical protein